MTRNILLTLTLCFLFGITALSQSKIIEDFMNEHSSKDGVTFVNILPKMLESTIRPDGLLYNSITVTKPSNSYDPTHLYPDFLKQLGDSNYEQYMEMSKGTFDKTSYHQKQINDSCKEIFIISINISIQNGKPYFSAIYMKGNIRISDVNVYLKLIRNYLNQLEMGFLPSNESLKKFDFPALDFSNFNLSFLDDISKQFYEKNLFDMEN